MRVIDNSAESVDFWINLDSEKFQRQTEPQLARGHLSHRACCMLGPVQWSNYAMLPEGARKD